VTHEEVFREPRDWCAARSRSARSIAGRKFYYVFTCEYCFSHYVAAVVLVFARFTMLYAGWRGYVVAWFALVWIANIYMSLFGRLRLEIREERAEITAAEAVAKASPDLDAPDVVQRGTPVASAFRRTSG
jgi:hypothetical protein